MELNVREFITQWGFENSVNYTWAITIIDERFPQFIPAMQELCNLGNTVWLDWFSSLIAETFDQVPKELLIVEWGAGTGNIREYGGNLANAVQWQMSVLLRQEGKL